VSDQKRPSGEPPAMILRSFHLQPGVTYPPSTPGYASSESYWDFQRHAKIRVEERPNGDVWLYTPNGTRIEISVLAISYKVRGPETLKQSEAVRRGA
jgi:hypothetical protein